MYNTNKTRFAMGFGAFFFDEDSWRAMLAGGVGSVNFQFYLTAPIDTWIPYSTALDFAFISNTIEIDNNHYFPFRDNRAILAARTYVGLGIGDLSFNQPRKLKSSF